VLKEDVAVPFEKLIQDKFPDAGRALALPVALTVLNGRPAQILTFQFDQIETNEHRIAAVALTAD
jgi:hypothetical protein